MLQSLVTMEAADLQCIDSTNSKAHRCSAGGKGGAGTQAIGRSRSGRTTKIHAVADRAGRLIAFDITTGQRQPPEADTERADVTGYIEWESRLSVLPLENSRREVGLRRPDRHLS
jgi:hypothetical protein